MVECWFVVPRDAGSTPALPNFSLLTKDLKAYLRRYKFFKRYKSDLLDRYQKQLAGPYGREWVGFGPEILEENRTDFYYLLRRLFYDKVNLRLIYKRFFSSLRTFNRFKPRRRASQFKRLLASQLKGRFYLRLNNIRLRRFFIPVIRRKAIASSPFVSFLGFFELRPDFLSLRLGLAGSITVSRLLSKSGLFISNGRFLSGLRPILPGSFFQLGVFSWAGFFGRNQRWFQYLRRTTSFFRTPRYLDFYPSIETYYVLHHPDLSDLRYPFRFRIDRIFNFYGVRASLP